MFSNLTRVKDIVASCTFIISTGIVMVMYMGQMLTCSARLLKKQTCSRRKADLLITGFRNFRMVKDVELRKT